MARLGLRRCLGILAVGLVCVSISIAIKSNSGAEILTSNASRAYLLSEAERSDARHDFERELDLLSLGLDANGSIQELVEIQRRQARLHWKVYEDYSKAREILDTVWAHEIGRADTALELARLEFAAGRFNASRDAAERAMSAAISRRERYDATIAISKPTIENATQLCLDGKAFDVPAVVLASRTLNSLLESEGVEPNVARMLIQAALLIGDGPAALSGWRAHYFISNDARPFLAIQDGAQVLERTMTNWVDQGHDEAVRRSITIALADTRLFREAAIVVYAAPPKIRAALQEDQDIRAILAYESFVDSVGRSIHQRYLLDARGELSGASFWEPFEAAIGKLWDQLETTSRTVPQYTRNTSAYSTDIERELGPRFGSVVRFVEIDGHRGLQMGHIVKDDLRKVEQYGHRAEVRFVVLDSMVSNGFASWAWNSGAQHGGWTDSDRIVQVRPPYASKPFRVWRQLTWEDERTRRSQETEKESLADRDRAKANPAGYLPGLSMRLHDQGAHAILDRLQSLGLENVDLQLAFVSEYGRAIEESSIFAHEGRHFIDRKNRLFPARAWRKEFNAKLSEVAFAPEPRLALGAIFASNIGDRGAHGRANESIMKDIVAWMKKHRNEIAALDTAQPILTQFDKLTDEQIRAVFRSMDSLAKNTRR